MQIVTDKNKVALYCKDNAVSYKEFILNTKKQRNKLLFAIFLTLILYLIFC